MSLSHRYRDVRVRVTDQQADSLRAFVAHAIGGGAKIPAPLEPHATNVMAILGSLANAQADRDVAERLEAERDDYR